MLAAALLHAGWNALIRAGSDKALDTALIHGLACLVALPLAIGVGMPPPESWPFVTASVVVHVGYYLSLAAAYRRGELALAYPLMRGTAPLLVALLGLAGLGEPPSGVGLLGVLAICAGVLAIAVASLGPAGAGAARGAIGFALVNAAIVAAYTLIDGHGVRQAVGHGGQAVQYVALLFCFEGLPYAAWVLSRRTGAARAQAWRYARRRWPAALAAACASLGAYGIALWAMTLAPVALVAALRETSILFALLIARWLLGERLGRRRVAGALLIVGGVVVLKVTG